MFIETTNSFFFVKLTNSQGYLNLEGNVFNMVDKNEKRLFNKKHW